MWINDNKTIDIMILACYNVNVIKQRNNAMNNKVKLQDTEHSIWITNNTVDISMELVINKQYRTVYATYNWVTDLFTLERVDIFSLTQFCDEEKLNINEFGERVYNLFKRNYKKQ